MGQHLTTWKERNGKAAKGVSMGLIFFTILSIAIYFYFDLKKDTDEVIAEESKKPIVITTAPSTSSKEEIVTKKGWMVDIKGEVKAPGTYAVDDSMRIIDVIYLAGELTEKADTSILNLSKKVEDQMVIMIYSKEEVKKMKETLEKEKELNLSCEKQILPNNACIESKEEEKTSSKININTASKEDLMTLDGIGTAKAEAILTYRSTKKFTTIEQLLEVPGIGESIFDGIKNNITVE